VELIADEDAWSRYQRNQRRRRAYRARIDRAANASTTPTADALDTPDTHTPVDAVLGVARRVILEEGLSRLSGDEERVVRLRFGLLDERPPQRYDEIAHALGMKTEAAIELFWGAIASLARQAEIRRHRAAEERKTP
jgi:DNA-directed RNA polymerase sigma subunit (sigma70/sigma32)